MTRRLLGVVVFGWLAVFLSGECRAEQPRYLLAPEDIASLKAMQGRLVDMFGWREEAGKSLRRVFADIAAKRGGKYSGNNWSVLQTFEQYQTGNLEKITLHQERFLVGGGCRAPYCDPAARYIVDTMTGHVAMAIFHPYTVDGKEIGPDDSWAVTQFMKSCVNPELRAFAQAFFMQWGRETIAERVARYGASQRLAESEGKTLTTRC